MKRCTKFFDRNFIKWSMKKENAHTEKGSSKRYYSYLNLFAHAACLHQLFDVSDRAFFAEPFLWCQVLHGKRPAVLNCMQNVGDFFQFSLYCLSRKKKCAWEF